MSFDPIYQQAAAQYNLDPDLLKAQGIVESGLNPQAVGPQTQYGQAKGIAQLLPSTAASLGVSDPRDPNQAIFGQAKLMAENIDRYGDPEKAVLAYHGGTDQTNWGQKTNAYRDKVAAEFQKLKGSQMQPDSPQDSAAAPQIDPVLGFLQSGPQQAQQPMEDPVLAHLTAPTTPDQSVQADPGIIAGIKRGFTGAGIGLNQFLNAGDQWAKNNLPQSVSDKLLYEIGNGTPSMDELQSRQADLEQMAKDNQASGKGTGFRGFVGEALGNPLTYVPGEGPIGQGLAYGASDAMLSQRPTDNGISGRLSQAAWEAPLDAGVSLGINKLLGKALAPAATSLTPEDQRLISSAQDAGISLSPGQQTNNSAYNWADKTLLNPGTNDMQLKQLTQASLEKSGASDPGFINAIAGKDINPSYASPSTISALQNYVGQKIGGATAGAQMPVDNELTGNILNVLDEYHGNTPNSMTKPMVDKMANDITSAPSMTGEAYQTTRSKLGDLAMKAYRSGDSEYADALSGMQNALDDKMVQNLSPDKATELAASRVQYSNLKTVMRSMASKDANTYSGIIPPSALDTAVKSVSREGFAKGNGQMNDLARVGMGLLRQPAENASKSQPTVTGMITGAATLIPKIIGQSAYNNPAIQNYLVKGAPLSPEALRLAQALAARSALVAGPTAMGNPNTPR